MARPLPLDLHHEVTTTDGTKYKLDANQPPGSRPQNFSFNTKIGEGFSDAALQLARRIDRDYPDLNLVDNWTVVGADGSVAYEGRNSAMPRDLSDTHSIGVILAGWMAHAKDRMFTEVYVDRDAGQWGAAPLNRRAALAVASQFQDNATPSVDLGGITWSLPASVPNTETDETWYLAPPGVTAAALGYRGTRTSFPAGMEAALVYTNTSRDGTGSFASTSLTLDDTLRSASFTAQPALMLRINNPSGSTVTPSTGAQQRFSKLAVYGNHGLTTRTGDSSEPNGLYLSDILTDVAARFCPLLNTSGVQQNTYVVQHCAFRDPTNPYDAFLELNKYALWHLGVWDNRTLTYKPYDLTDYDWEIRTDDPGTTFSPQGPSTDSLFNGIAVTYTDPLTGVVGRLTPETNPELKDASSTNPWNTHGINRWDEITLSTPTLAAQASPLGQAALADRNRPKTPGTITVRGYVRDRAGNPQPVWKVRAGDTISITNFPNDTPRLIVETSYDDERKQVSLAVDKPFALLDAYLDRLANAVTASGVA